MMPQKSVHHDPSSSLFSSSSSLPAVKSTADPTLLAADANIVVVVAQNDAQDDDEDDNDATPSSATVTTTTAAAAATADVVDVVLFFVSGIGSSLGYVGTLSAVVYFQYVVFPEETTYFVWLNVAVYGPTVPIAFAQARYDYPYDIQYQTRTTFVVRGIVGYLSCLVGTILILYVSVLQEQSSTVPSSKYMIIAFTAVQGTGGAILYGLLNQLASFLKDSSPQTPSSSSSSSSAAAAASSSSRTYQATVSAGVQASAVLVGLVSYGTGLFRIMDHSVEDGTSSSSSLSSWSSQNQLRHHATQVFVHFVTILLIVQLVCGACCLWLLLGRPRIVQAMAHRDASIRQQQQQQQQRWRRRRPSPPTTAAVLSQQQEQPLLLDYHYPDDDDDGFTDNDPRNEQRCAAIGTPRQLTSTSFTRSYSSSDDEYVEQFRQPRSEDEKEDYEEGEERTTVELWDYSKRCCSVLLLTLIPSFVVGSWFGRIRTKWTQLPQILFYTRIGCDFLGRLATLMPVSTSAATPSATGSTDRPRPDPVVWLLWIAGLRWVLVILFFLNAGTVFHGSSIVRPTYQDGLSIALVGWVAFLSGYLVTSCYQLAPTQLPVRLRGDTNVTKQASLLTVAFAVSAVIGLSSSFVLIAIGV